MYGLYFAQHINDKMQLTLNWAQTELSNKALDGLVNLDAESTQTLQYLVAQTEYTLFQGEILTAKSQQMADLYITTGVGITDFEQKNYFTMVLGTGVNIDFNDWLTLNTSVRGHRIEDNRLGKSDTSYNIEFTTGIHLVF